MSERAAWVVNVMILIVWLLPLLVAGWLLSLASRAVRALESIAESLRQQK